MKINQEKQLQGLERFIDNMGKFQNIFKDDPRVDIHPDKIAAAFGALADIKGADEFVSVKDGPSPQEEQLMQENQQLQEQMQQMQHDAQMKELQDAQQQAATPEMVHNSAGAFRDPDIAGVAEQIAKM